MIYHIYRCHSALCVRSETPKHRRTEKLFIARTRSSIFDTFLQSDLLLEVRALIMTYERIRSSSSAVQSMCAEDVHLPQKETMRHRLPRELSCLTLWL